MSAQTQRTLLRRIAAVLVFVAMLPTLISCAPSTPQISPSDVVQSPSAASSASPQDSSAAPAVITSVNPAGFISNLTANGTGLVRDVPASMVNVKEPSDWNGILDLRWLDCTKYLTGEENQKLLDTFPNIDFNTATKWPENLPAGFDPSAVLDAGKNPGLGVNALHELGITGKGVSIAIFDQTLLTGHTEYKDNLALYEEIHVLRNEPAAMHGSAVASIAVGKTCGVAPDAQLFYWAVNLGKTQSITSSEDKNIAFAEGLSAAVDRMLEVNAKLPEGQKIRVLSISRGFSDLKDEGVHVFLKAIERAEAAGIFVITTSSFQYSDFMTMATDFGGLGKADMTGNPDDLSTYTLGGWEQSNASVFADKLLVPMDGRTTADFTGKSDYVFYAQGGFSWVAPYLAGLYALACQVKPDVTPDVFWKTALETASKMTVTISGKSCTFSHIVNPPALNDALK